MEEEKKEEKEEESSLVEKTPPPLCRAYSSTVSNQELSPTCWAHTSARVLARLVKNVCVLYNKNVMPYCVIYNKNIDKYFNGLEAENCSYYYTEYCVKHPFECFKKTKNPKSKLCKTSENSIDETGNLKENVSAALYSFIYKNLINLFGCRLGHADRAISKFQGITENATVKTIASDLIELDWYTGIFSSFETGILSKICSKEPKRKNINIDKFLETNPYIKSICEKVHELITFYNDILVYNLIQVKRIHNKDEPKEVFIETLKSALGMGFYASLRLSLDGKENRGHVMTIINFREVENKNDIILIVKNSWGEDNAPINSVKPVNGLYEFSYNELMDNPAYKSEIEIVFAEKNTRTELGTEPCPDPELEPRPIPAPAPLVRNSGWPKENPEAQDQTEPKLLVRKGGQPKGRNGKKTKKIIIKKTRKRRSIRRKMRRFALTRRDRGLP